MFLVVKYCIQMMKLQNEVTTDISKGYKTTNKAWLMYLEGEQQKYKFY